MGALEEQLRPCINFQRNQQPPMRPQHASREVCVCVPDVMSKVNSLETTTPRIPATSSRVERSRTCQGEDALDHCLPRCLKDSCSDILTLVTKIAHDVDSHIMNIEKANSSRGSENDEHVAGRARRSHPPSVSTVVEHGSTCCETHGRSLLLLLFSFLFDSSDWVTELTQSRRLELTEPPPHGHSSARDRLSEGAALCWLSTSSIFITFSVKSVIAFSFAVPCSGQNILFHSAIVQRTQSSCISLPPSSCHVKTGFLFARLGVCRL